MTIHLRCPVCHQALVTAAHTVRCGAGHSFDVAADGHLNLLLSGRRRSREPGDSKEMVRNRRAFLGAGHYEPLARALARSVAGVVPVPEAAVVDVGCGEGSFTRAIRTALPDATIVGIDVSKPAVISAARRDRTSTYAVASAFDLPVVDDDVDALVVNFAPTDAGEFSRVLHDGGTVVTAHPGPRHLFALRVLVYDRPELHQPKGPLRHAPDLFEPVEEEPVRFPLTLSTSSEVAQLLAMTPYWWQADTDKQEAIAALPGLETEVDVLLTTYRRRPRGRR